MQAYLDRFVEMGLMNESEKADALEIMGRVANDGGLYEWDRALGEHRMIKGDMIALEYAPVRGKQFLIDTHGVPWRLGAIGSEKAPHLPDGGGVKRRSPKVEMWTGRWVQDVEGEWSKNTVWISLEKNVNAHKGMTNIDWHRHSKGFKHPFEEPQAPTVRDKKLATRTDATLAPRVKAVMEDVEARGMDAVLGRPDALEAQAPPRVTAKKRTNRARQKNG